MGLFAGKHRPLRAVVIMRSFRAVLFAVFFCNDRDFLELCHFIPLCVLRFDN